MSILVTVGVDVGGTNTDAAVLHKDIVLGSAKTLTTPDVTSGVAESIRAALDAAKATLQAESLLVKRVHIGTNQFLNAVIQRKHLVKVCVIRLCGLSSRSIIPHSGLPEDLKQVISGGSYLIDGGFEFDGNREIAKVNKQQVLDIISELKQKNMKNIVIAGIFSPKNNIQENYVGQIFQDHYPEASLTLSHQVGSVGLLERENAAVLNESLKPLFTQTVQAFRIALNYLDLTCDFFFTKNDGSLSTIEDMVSKPVHTFASGITNSIRGAAYLTGLDHAIVVDIGGISTDVGILPGDYSKETVSTITVGGVRTNLRLPFIVSAGLGGGSIISFSEVEGNIQATIGPNSTGFKLVTEGLVFGGATCTATDIAVAAGLVEIGDPMKVKNMSSENVQAAINKIHNMLEYTIDQIKTSGDKVPVVLVGGGSVLIDLTKPLGGTTEVIRPSYHAVASAIGAALCQMKAPPTVSCNNDSHSLDNIRSQVKDVDGQLKPMEVERAAEWKGGSSTRTRNIPDKNNEQHEEGIPWLFGASGQSLLLDDAKCLVEETEPRIENGEWILSEWDLECLAIGAGILGCGGGGSAYLGKLRALNVLRAGKQIRVVTPERMSSQMCENDMVIPVAILGAPSVIPERIASSENQTVYHGLKELYSIGQYADHELKNDYGIELNRTEDIVSINDYKPTKLDGGEESQSRIVGLFSAEIGGCNCLEPLVLGGEVGLPVIDCDCMGRAFPEVQQLTPLIQGHPPYPACLADYKGRRTIVLYARSAKQLEDFFREVCIDMGGVASLGLFPLNKQDILSKVIPYSISRAWHLGYAVLRAQKNKTSPVQSILDQENGRILCIGKICDVKRKTGGDFDRGELRVKGLNDFIGCSLLITFQNENLIATMSVVDGTSEIVACTPDLISVVECCSGHVVPTEEVRCGLQVAAIVIPAPPMLLTPEALRVVGPQGFGYTEEEVQFKPVGGFVERNPIPPT